MQIIKLKSGTYVPGMGLVSIPTGISRTNETDKRGGGWVLSYSMFPDAQFHWFSDYAWGTVGAALQAAITELKRVQHADDITIGRRLATEEYQSKITKLGVVGVSYYIVEVRPGYFEHRFDINNPATNTGTTVYIGTDNTVDANWDAAFEKARDIRHGFEQEYTRYNYWHGLYDTLLGKQNTKKEKAAVPA